MVDRALAGGHGFAFRALGGRGSCSWRIENRGEPIISPHAVFRRFDPVATCDRTDRLSCPNVFCRTAVLHLWRVVLLGRSVSAENVTGKSSGLGILRIWFRGCDIRFGAEHRLQWKTLLAQDAAIRRLDLWSLRKP